MDYSLVTKVTVVIVAWLNSVYITHPWFSFKLWLNAPTLLAFRELPVDSLGTDSQVKAPYLDH